MVQIKKFKKTWLNEDHYNFLVRKGNGKVGEGLDILINDYYIFQEKIKQLNDDNVSSKLWGDKTPELVNPFLPNKENDKSEPKPERKRKIIWY